MRAVRRREAASDGLTLGLDRLGAVDAAPVQVHQEPGYAVQQPVAVGAGRQPHQQPPALERMCEALRHEDRGAALGRLGEADGENRRQSQGLEALQHLVLATGRVERHLLEGVGDAFADVSVIDDLLVEEVRPQIRLRR